MNTIYEQIVDTSAIGEVNNPIKLNDILPLAAGECLSPASQDKSTALLLAIDVQQDFMDKGALGVPGASKDVERLTRWMFNNTDKITQIAASIDTHNPFQIFHPAWWIDDNGNNPAPFTAITLADLDAGKWKPVLYPLESREYVENLEKLGKKVLVIWTYHCLQGTAGCALENQFANMLYFHSVARRTMVQRIVKGQDPLSEMYGIIKPEYDRKNSINLDFLNKIEKFDKVVISGQAKSHCVLESIKQILEYYAKRPEVTRKIFILEDTMSMIPGFEAPTATAFEEFKKIYKVNLVTTQDFNL